MSTIAPAPTTAPPTVSGDISTVAAVAVDPPEEMRSLPPGTELVARALEAAKAGQVRVSTPYGEVTLKTALPLPAGASLALILAGGGSGGSASSSSASLILRIQAIDGHSPAKFLSSFPVSGSSVGGSPGGGLSRGGAFPVTGGPQDISPHDTLSIGQQSVRGILLDTLAGRTIAGNGLSSSGGVSVTGFETPKLPAGTVFVLRLGSDTPVQQATFPGSSQLPAPGGAGVAVNTPPGAPATIQGPPVSVAGPVAGPVAGAVVGPVAGGELTPSPGVLPQTVSPSLLSAQGVPSAPSVSPSPDTPLQSGMRLNGEVLASPAGNASLVKTNIGVIALDTRLALPVGSSVTLSLATDPLLPQSSAASSPLSGTRTAPSASAWPALDDALTFLREIDPAAATALLRAIPAPDPRFAANVLSFLPAAEAGAPKRWTMAERAITALEEAEDERGPKILERLESDLRDAATRPRQSGDWRIHTLPFALGGKIERIEVVTRRLGELDPDNEQAEAKKGGGGLRFLIDLSLSRLGSLQFDGLFKKRERRFDLIIRTHAALPPEMRREMLGMFTLSAQALGLNGNLGFAVSDTFPGPEAEARVLGNGPGVVV